MDMNNPTEPQNLQAENINKDLNRTTPQIIVQGEGVDVQPQPQTDPSVATPPEPKRKIPKVPLIIIGGVLLLLIIFFVVRNILNSNKKEEEIVITYWGLWEDSLIIQPLISEYESKNPGIKIEYLRQSHQDYRERLTSAMSKGNAPDLFRFHSSWTPIFKKELDYIPPSVMSAGEFVQTFYPVATADLTSETGIVGVPLEYDAITLFINEDIFASAGKTPPKTWDEMTQLARELTIKDERGSITQAGVALGRVENVDHWQEILALMMLQNGADLSKPTGKLAENALLFFTSFSGVHGVWDQTLPPSTTAFAAGKLAMYFAPSWRIFEILQQNPNIKVRAINVPQLPSADPSEPGISYATYWVEGVWAKSKDKAAAWDFLRFLSTKESLQKLYQNASKVRLFGEPYPRVDMASLLTSDPIVGVVIANAANAQSWYLHSRTWDGPTGINTLLSKYYEDAVTSVNTGGSVSEALNTASLGINQVLTQYGLISR